MTTACAEVLFERGEDGAAIVRIKLARPRMASLEADGPGWIVNIADTTTAERVRSPSRAASSARIAQASPFRSTSARAVHTIKDPDVGDRLLVITALGPARGFLKVQDFVELRALPSIHGVGIAADRRRHHGRAWRRQDLDQPADGTVAVGDSARPAAGRGQLSRLHLRYPALGLRPRCASSMPGRPN